MQNVKAFRVTFPESQTKYVDLTYVRLVVDTVRKLRIATTQRVSSVLNESPLGSFQLNE